MGIAHHGVQQLLDLGGGFIARVVHVGNAAASVDKHGDWCVADSGCDKPKAKVGGGESWMSAPFKASAGERVLDQVGAASRARAFGSSCASREKTSAT